MTKLTSFLSRDYLLKIVVNLLVKAKEMMLPEMDIVGVIQSTAKMDYRKGRRRWETVKK